ncbi:hypothetical protein DHB74_02665 [Pseudomonas sp. G11-1]|nr:hypothetical protein [Pseudomonas sp. G11-1]MCO5788643.1 hypothetical protein [Pseudomonas sp. G11-2]
MVDWNDLKFFLETVKAGSYIEASRRLGVDRTTVARRIHALEKQLDAPLFEQTATGYHPTTVGKYVLACSNKVDQLMREFSEKIKKHEADAVGCLRLAVSTCLCSEIIDPLMQDQKMTDNIRISTDLVARPLEYLKQRKADAALILTSVPEDGMDGFLVGRFSASVYKADSYLQMGLNVEWDSERWVGWTKNVTESILSNWTEDNVVDKACIVARYNTYDLIKRATSQGLGLSILLDSFVSEKDNLAKVFHDVDLIGCELYVVRLSAVPLDINVQAAIELIVSDLQKYLLSSDGFIVS